MLSFYPHALIRYLHTNVLSHSFHYQTNQLIDANPFLLLALFVLFLVLFLVRFLFLVPFLVLVLFPLLFQQVNVEKKRRE